MKVLAISSSPRKKGNSEVLCDQFLKGAAENGHEVEKIWLGNQHIEPCSACYYCLEHDACIKQDGFYDLKEKLIQADVIVLSTPVYFYCMSAQMKLFIDRTLGFYRELKGKAFYFIITCADPEHSGTDETLAGLRGFLKCIPDAKEKGIIYGTGTWQKGDVYQHPAYIQAYQLGKEI